MSLDDEEEDAEDVADLLDRAKKEGKNESFTKANALLEQAKMYGVNKDDTQEASQYVAGKKKAKDDRLERARQARLAQQSSGGGNYYSSSDMKNMCLATSGQYEYNCYNIQDGNIKNMCLGVTAYPNNCYNIR
jgi:hypothetical protein